MITAVERGRKLVITVGDDEDHIDIVVPPVSTAVGSGIFALWAGIMFAQSEQAEVDAVNMSKLALGEENWPVVEDLRSAESTLVINAALFWNVQGGGIELVREMLRDGLPKAQETLAGNNGLGQVFSQLQTLLDSGLANQTLAPAVIPATSTQPGSVDSFGLPVTEPKSDGD